MTIPMWMLLGFATWTLLLLMATVGVYMNKITPDPPENPSLSTSDSLYPAQLSKVAQRALCDPLRNPKSANSISHIFTIAPERRP